KEVVVHEDINDLDQTVRFIKNPDPENPERVDQLDNPQTPENLSKSDNDPSEIGKIDKASKNEKRTILTERMPKNGDDFSLLTLLFGSLLVVIGSSILLNKRKQHL
ncbi:hypothetical protein, partial [Listeria grandensis]|uniref:hypothetical protein n=1 Tax=Listeria grandensis TaxID=1494963 RepID=UPI00164EA8B7